MRVQYYISFLLFFYTTLNAQETKKDSVTFSTEVIPAISPESNYDPDRVYPLTVMHIFPKFPKGKSGFIDEILQNINTSDNGAPKGFTGKCYISFVIEKDGTLSSFRLLRDSEYNFGNEVIEAAKKITQKWKPGIYYDKPARCLYMLMIKIDIPQ